MNKKQKELAIKFLDERYEIANKVDSEEDWCFYRGAIAMIEAQGYEWERFEGKHKIYESWCSGR